MGRAGRGTEVAGGLGTGIAGLVVTGGAGDGVGGAAPIGPAARPIMMLILSASSTPRLGHRRGPRRQEYVGSVVVMVSHPPAT